MDTFFYLVVWEPAKVLLKQPADENYLKSFNKWILLLEGLMQLDWRLGVGLVKIP